MLINHKADKSWARINLRVPSSFAFAVGGIAAALLLLGIPSTLLAQSSPLTVQPSTGRVGVGNTNPQYPLDVTGTVNATSFRGDGSQLTNLPSSGSNSLLHKIATDTTIVGNTTTETILYSFSVAGGTLGTDNTLRLTLRGKVTKLSSAANMTFRIKYGATTLTSGFVIDQDSTSNHAWQLVIELSADGSETAQIMHAVGSLEWIPPPSEETTVTWKSNNGNTARMVRGTSTTDSTAAQDIVVTGKWSQSITSGSSVTMEYAMLEKLS